MKNITVSVNEDLYHRARVRAAEKRTSLSALVRNYLTHLVEEEPEFERLRREQDKVLARIRRAHGGFSAGQRLSRDQVHDRASVR